MSVNAVIYIEDSSRVGIWPSHLDGIRAVCAAYGVDEIHYIDHHVDGYLQEYPGPPVAQKRFASLAQWYAAEGSNSLIVLETQTTITTQGKTPTSLLAFSHPVDASYLIGASNGHEPDAWDIGDSFVYLPQGQIVGLESRDALTIVIAHRFLQSLG